MTRTESADFGLRPATESDSELAFQILKAALGEYVAQTWGWNEQYQRQRHADDFDPAAVEIITCDGKDIGRLEVQRESDVICIANIFILPEFQGRGIGSSLVRQVLAEAARAHLPVELGVLKVNRRAKDLYERFGFRQTSETATHFMMIARPGLDGKRSPRIVYREMAPEEMSRIGEVNREETVTGEFITKPTGSGLGLEAALVSRNPALKIARWDATGTAERIEQFGEYVKRGGFFYGAFDGDRLVGFIVIGPKDWDNSVEVAGLFVDKDYRHRKIGAKLITWAANTASELGATALMVYANPTAVAVTFYLAMGFEIVGLVSKQFVKNIAADIIMAKRIN